MACNWECVIALLKLACQLFINEDWPAKGPWPAGHGSLNLDSQLFKRALGTSPPPPPPPPPTYLFYSFLSTKEPWCTLPQSLLHLQNTAIFKNACIVTGVSLYFISLCITYLFLQQNTEFNQSLGKT